MDNLRDRLKNTDEKVITRTVMFLVLIAASFVSAPSAMAYQIPAVGSFAYSVYDIVYNDLISGAPGTTFGIGAMTYAGVKCLGPDIPRVLGGLIAGGLFLKGQELAVSLGATF